MPSTKERIVTKSRNLIYDHLTSGYPVGNGVVLNVRRKSLFKHGRESGEKKKTHRHKMESAKDRKRDSVCFLKPSQLIINASDIMVL